MKILTAANGRPYVKTREGTRFVSNATAKRAGWKAKPSKRPRKSSKRGARKRARRGAR